MRLIRHAQDNFQQCDAELLGRGDLCRLPGHRLPVHGLLPGLETLARGETRAIRAKCDGLFGITRPVHLVRKFLAEEDDIIARAAGHGHGEEAGCAVHIVLCGRVGLAQRVCGIDPAAGGRVEEADNAHEFLTGRCAPQRDEVAIHPGGHAVIGDDGAQGFGDGREMVADALATGELGHELIVKDLRAPAVFTGLVSQQLAQHEAEHLGKELCRRADFIGQDARLIMVAGKEAPEVVAVQDRDGQGRIHAHILQIFDMDRGDRAQSAHGEVERLAFGAALGDDRGNGFVHIRDDAQQVAPVKFAGLLRDVGRRIAKAKK